MVPRLPVRATLGISALVCSLLVICTFGTIPKERRTDEKKVIASFGNILAGAPKNSSSALKTVRRYKKQEMEMMNSQRNLNKMSEIIRLNSNNLPGPQFPNVSMSEICENDNGSLACIPPFKNLESKYTVSAKYNLAACVIQKSMSTVMAALMCFLHNEQKFKEAGRQFMKECHDVRFCAYKNEYASIKKIRDKFNLKPDDWKLILVTRDPVDRFLSGFVDKCIRKPKTANYCNGCRSNMTCFLISEYKRMKTQVERNRLVRSFDDRHFFPQNWRCNLNNEYHRFQFLRYSPDPSQLMLADLLSILKKQKVPQSSIDFISQQFTQGRTVHSTVQSEARQYLEKRLRRSPFLMEYLVRMFYFDFKLFNYNLPPGFN